MNAEIHPSAPYLITWWRGALFLLALGALDCLWAWGLMQATSLAVSYAYGHGSNDTIRLSVWMMVIGWAVGIIFHLVALNRAAQRHQKATAAAIITSGLWLTWLCAIAGAISVYSALIADIFHALPSH